MTSTRLRRVVCASLGIVSVAVPGVAIRAQVKDTTASGRTIIPRDTANARANQTLFTYRDGALAVGFVALTVALFPADRHLAERLRDPQIQANKFLGQSATGLEFVASPGAYVIGGTLYAIGRFSDHDDLEDLGWHGTESVALASGITYALKGLFGRARPYVVGDTNPHDFKLFTGFRAADRQSFPSGHAAAAFAVAASVTSEVNRVWPRATWYAAPLLYGGATLVGLSRMYHNNHWASDVVLGAAIGTFSGLKVVKYSHAHPDNLIDRWIIGASVAPDGHGGGAVMFTFPAGP